MPGDDATLVAWAYLLASSQFLASRIGPRRAYDICQREADRLAATLIEGDDKHG